jgi:capsular polysaccharide biosynthesis protein
MNETSTTGNAGMVQIIRFFLRNYLLIFVVPFVLSVVIFFATAYMTPVYRAETLLVPAEESGGGSLSAMLSSFGGLGRLAGLGGAGPSRKDEALAMLRSRSFVSAFIESANGFAVLYPEAWDDEAGTWRPGKAIPSEQDRYLLFTESVLSAAENKESGIIKIAISLNDRLVAANWANAIVDSLNEKFRGYVAAEAQNSIEYLYGELEKASSVELRQVIHRLIEAQIQTIMLTNVRKDFVFRVVDPAVAPDADYFVSPRRALLAFIGLIVGGFLGLGIALFREAMGAARAAEATVAK